ncbi:MAG TPA: hypothetical protein VJ972_09130 [Anaerolineales bacterium]|nr:hypothetical protein [Anaerolineales bacterium]
MADIGSRIERAIVELTGNEALLGMLETDAATEMLDWGIKLSTYIVNQAGEMDDLAAEISLLPRLKAVRKSMRSIGNWAVGKYVEPEDRLQLRDKLLDQFGTILGESAPLPSVDDMDDLLNQVDDSSNTHHQLIVKMIQLMGNKKEGDLNG